MATAQETFDALMREGVRPRLQSMAFRGSGPTFSWPASGVFALLGFQKSQFSDRESLKFTVNLTVVGEQAWEDRRQARQNLPTKPAANTIYGLGVWQTRIGLLLPASEDRWWWLNADEDWRPTADEVVEAIEQYALPELTAQVKAAAAWVPIAGDRISP